MCRESPSREGPKEPGIAISPTQPDPGEKLSEHLFAYGTLQPGHAPEEIAHLLRRLEVIGKGTIAGTLYDLGSHPGVLLNPVSSRRVAGTVFRLPEDERVLPALDEYEEYWPESPGKSQFIRRVCPVQLTDGRALECWVYEYNRSVNEVPILESGKYTRSD